MTYLVQLEWEAWNQAGDRDENNSLLIAPDMERLCLKIKETLDSIEMENPRVAWDAKFGIYDKVLETTAFFREDINEVFSKVVDSLYCNCKGYKELYEKYRDNAEYV